MWLYAERTNIVAVNFVRLFTTRLSVYMLMIFPEFNKQIAKPQNTAELNVLDDLRSA